MRGLLTSFAKNRVFANIFLAIVILSGSFAGMRLVRETFPEFTLDMITVSVPWPGADPEEVEEGICRKLEEAVKGIPGVRQFDTVAAESRGVLTVEVAENYPVDEVKDRVKNQVDAISSFPTDAERPITEEVIMRREVLLVALSGDAMTERQFRELAEDIKDELRTLPGVSQVQVLGGRDYEIGIEVSEERLREYGLTFAQVAAVVRANSLNVPGGVIRTQGEEIRLRTLGRNYTGADFAKIVLLARPDGQVVTLDRVATIRDDFVEDLIESKFNGRPTITIAVLKTSDEDTLAIDAGVRGWITERNKTLPPGLHLDPWGGSSDILKARISLLLRNGAMSLVIIFIILLLFLDSRLSFWISMGMPIATCGTLALMLAFGLTLNMISLFALIMVLGIIVDDAIVVGESIYHARKNGAPPLRAAVEGVMEVGLPVLGSVTTTVVAFLPLMFVQGIMGKFIYVLPAIVISALTMSLVESLFMFPAHLNSLPDPHRAHAGRHWLLRPGLWVHRMTNRGMDAFIVRIYAPLLGLAIRHRYAAISLAVAALLVTMGLFQGGFVKFLVFPKIDGNVVTATVEFPNGTPLEITRGAVDELEKAFERVAPGVKTLSGAPLVLNSYSLAGGDVSGVRPATGSHIGAVRVEMIDTAERGVSSDEIAAKWEEEVGAIPGAVALTISSQMPGPGGTPIEVWVQGADLDEILSVAEKTKAWLRDFDGVYQIQHDFRPGKNEFRLRLKPEARTLGLSVSDLGRQVFAGYFGEEAVRIQRGRDDIRVRVRYPYDERRSLEDFERIRIRTPQGREVPLPSVADVDFGPGFAVINRTNGFRKVAVTADVNFARANPSEIFAEMERSLFPRIKEEHPRVMVSLQGENKRRNESLGSLFLGYPLALMGIYIIIAAIFRSYVQPLVIMATVPFGMVGAVLGHLMLGYDVTMMSIFGIVALSGVVVNDAIVLIDCMNTFIAGGMPAFDAFRQAGVRRFRAVFLTTATTAGGLSSLLFEKDLQARFLIPMAISLAVGIIFATVLTLVFIPCLMGVVNDLRRGLAWLKTGRMPGPGEVEPARMAALRDLENELAAGGPPARAAEEAGT